LVFLRARYYDPGIGRFISKDPFPGVPSLPSTLHPYQYALNNPINLVDPSGEIIPAIITAMAAGVIIGGIMGGIGYALSHPGLSLGDMLSSVCFWQSVLVGQISGAIAGAVGWAVGAAAPALMLKYGITAKMTLGLTLGVGWLSGSLASVVGQITTNLFLGMDPGEGVGFAFLSGGVIGMITAGVGFKLHQLINNMKNASQTSRVVLSGHGEYQVGRGLTTVPDFENTQSAFRHYAKHVRGVEIRGTDYRVWRLGPDIPEFTSFNQYRTAARGFLSGPIGIESLQIVRQSGDVVRFNPSSGWFGVKSNEGTIRTFFRPQGSIVEQLAYFWRQVLR
jgi:hypothetical protein